MVTASNYPPLPGDSFEQFLSSRRDPDGNTSIVSARRYADALHVDLHTLASQAHVHRCASKDAHHISPLHQFGIFAKLVAT
jgi:hypothetical protein